MAETPELKRIAENTKIQSNVSKSDVGYSVQLEKFCLCMDVMNFRQYKLM
jgi:hypothetical protein